MSSQAKKLIFFSFFIMLGVTVLVWLILSLASLEDVVSIAILMNLILISLNRFL